jgi:hypothetical protein
VLHNVGNVLNSVNVSHAAFGSGAPVETDRVARLQTRSPRTRRTWENSSPRIRGAVRCPAVADSRTARRREEVLASSGAAQERRAHQDIVAMQQYARVSGVSERWRFRS